MSTESRRKNTSVIEELTDRPYVFSFKQAVRLLERSNAPVALSVTNTSNRNNTIARFMRPSSEFIRFSKQQSLSFPSSEISTITAPPKGSKTNQWKMGISFIGLTGNGGILPHHYTEIALQRLRLKDKSITEFFNLFNHRTISLFFQASCKYDFPIEYERKRLNPENKTGTDHCTQALLSLIGLGTKNLTKRLYMKDESLIYYSGLLTSKVRTASSLKQMIKNHFNIPVEIKEFVGQWQDLFSDVRTRLPKNSTAGQNHCLGKSVMLGRQGWFAQGKIKIILGPLTKSQLKKFSPRSSVLKSLDEMIRLYMGFDYDYSFVMRINKKDIPERAVLSATEPAIVGWTTWLSSKTDKTANSNETVDIAIASRH